MKTTEESLKRLKVLIFSNKQELIKRYSLIYVDRKIFDLESRATETEMEKDRLQLSTKNMKPFFFYFQKRKNFLDYLAARWFIKSPIRIATRNMLKL